MAGELFLMGFVVHSLVLQAPAFAIYVLFFAGVGMVASLPIRMTVSLSIRWCSESPNLQFCTDDLTALLPLRYHYRTCIYDLDVDFNGLHVVAWLSLCCC